MIPTVEVTDISKRYRINHKNKASYSTVKDDLSNLIKHPLGIGKKSSEKEEEFWALKDVSFSVNQGEVFGIIGHNGSGKSTLLKILSRVIEPTEGKAILRGRVASLLEVGTGFHPELTGRENVYFNGSMLGMSKQEISRKFNTIVEFSEVEKFLDTPVKFYSSGMYVRLAFAVAAHLDPDILILDEVLSVGDASFQRKSLEKMLSIANSGSTIIYVSHGLASVEKLCERAMLLNKGQVVMIGDTTKVAEKYLSDELPGINDFQDVDSQPEEEQAEINIPKIKKDFLHNYRVSNGIFERDDKDALLQRATIINKHGDPTTGFRYGDPLTLRIETNKKATDKKYALEVRLKNADFKFLGFTSSLIEESLYFSPGDTIELLLPPLHLLEGSYCLDVICRDPHNYHCDNWWNTLGFRILSSKPGKYPISLSSEDELGEIILHGVIYKNA